MIDIQPSEIIRSQNFIQRCDFWFAITALNGAFPFPNTAQQVVRRSESFGDYINQFDVDLLKPDSVVFCKFDYLQHLADYLQFKNCNKPFVLLTGQSDFSITDHAFGYMKSRLSHPLNWWGCNNESDLANGIPLGIADDFCKLTVKEGFCKTKGTRLLYVNHRIDTFPMVRKPLYELFSDKSWSTVRVPSEKGTAGSYREELLDHKFMLCPRGNGVDTHRMWEALYCGVIPIVQRHKTHCGLEGNLPILFVDSFYEVTEDLLKQTYEEFKTKTWNTDMLKVSWWMKQMKESTNG